MVRGGEKQGSSKKEMVVIPSLLLRDTACCCVLYACCLRAVRCCCVLLACCLRMAACWCARTARCARRTQKVLLPFLSVPSCSLLPLPLLLIFYSLALSLLYHHSPKVIFCYIKWLIVTVRTSPLRAHLERYPFPVSPPHL